MHIYLASKSPRRQSLLTQIDVTFDCISVDIDESTDLNETPLDYVRRMAHEKAEAGWNDVKRQQNIPLLAADTSVIFADQILGKPENKVQAVEMLRLLSGQTHQVLTGLSIRSGQKSKYAVSITDVSFTSLSPLQIDYYVNSGDCFDKAGSYGIQGYAACFVKSISGSYSGVVGLPLFETAKLLQEFRHLC